jgi:prepilin-type N-terminal cleavage/methylation domain-containing protein
MTRCSAVAGARPSEQGYSLVELLVVVGLIAVVTVITVLVMPGAVTAAKGQSAMLQVEAALRTAREQAIGQRRAMRVTFTAPNLLVVSRVEQPGPGVTVIGRNTLENGYQFLLFAGQPDTPDAFGRAAAVDLGGAATVQFTSEGTFVDQNGDEANASIFVGRQGDALSAAAVTVFGPTALIRGWRWNGAAWSR